MSKDAMKATENPVCTTDFDLPTPPWGHDGLGDPGEPHPDEPGLGSVGAASLPAAEAAEAAGDDAEDS